MGTTYQAQVEVLFPGSVIWQEVSSWELQKDYSFAIAWSEVATRGWPKDVCLISKSEYEPDGYDYDHMYIGEGYFLAELEPKDPFPWFIELREHVRRLLRDGYKVRVLTWGT